MGFAFFFPLISNMNFFSLSFHWKLFCVLSEPFLLARLDWMICHPKMLIIQAFNESLLKVKFSFNWLCLTMTNFYLSFLKKAFLHEALENSSWKFKSHLLVIDTTSNRLLQHFSICENLFCFHLHELFVLRSTPFTAAWLVQHQLWNAFTFGCVYPLHSSYLINQRSQMTVTLIYILSPHLSRATRKHVFN